TRIIRQTPLAPGTGRETGPAHRGLIRTAIPAGFSRLFIVNPAALAPGTGRDAATSPPPTSDTVSRRLGRLGRRETGRQVCRIISSLSANPPGLVALLDPSRAA